MTQLSIGEAAERVGVQTSTLRYYEQIGLLPAVPRKNGQRRYPPEVIQRLEMVGLAKELGFSLAEIQVLLDGLSASSPPPERWQAIAAAKLPQVDRLIARAQMMKQILQKGLDCECVTIEDCFAVLSS